MLIEDRVKRLKEIEIHFKLMMWNVNYFAYRSL